MPPINQKKNLLSDPNYPTIANAINSIGEFGHDPIGNEQISNQICNADNASEALRISQDGFRNSKISAWDNTNSHSLNSDSLLIGVRDFNHYQVHSNLHTHFFSKHDDISISYSIASGFTSTESSILKTPPIDTNNSSFLIAAVNLAARAYSNAHFHNDMAKIGAINATLQAWSPITSKSLGITPDQTSGTIADGHLFRYEYGNASATIGWTILDGKKTLGIAFEGTNFDTQPLDLWDDIVDIGGHANKLSGLMAAVATYANVASNGIEQVLVTGHSLGGSIAQEFMERYGSDPRYRGATFGNPGTLAPSTIDASRFVNFSHTGDAVPYVGEYGVKIANLGLTIVEMAGEIKDSFKKASLATPATVAAYAIDSLVDAISKKVLAEAAYLALGSYFGLSTSVVKKGLEDAINRSDYSIVGTKVRFDLSRINDTIIGITEHSIFESTNEVNYAASLKTYLDYVGSSSSFQSGFYLIGTSAADALQTAEVNAYTLAFGNYAAILGGNGADVIGEHTLLSNDNEPNVMFGGLGNDTYYYDHLSDAIVEKQNEGTDQIIAYLDVNGLPVNVENLTLISSVAWFDANLNGTGNNLANAITGNNGNNNLAGLDGADTLIGQSGNDTLLGGPGDDLLMAQSGGDLLQGGTGNDRYQVTRVDYDVMYSSEVPTYILSDDAGSADSLSIIDDEQGTLTGIKDLNFKLVGQDLWIDLDIVRTISNDDDDGRIIIKNQLSSNNQIETLYLFDRFNQPIGSGFSLTSVVSALQAKGTNEWWRVSAGSVATNGTSLGLVSGSNTSGDSTGKTVVGGSLGLNIDQQGQLIDIGYTTSYTVKPSQVGALEINLNLVNESSSSASIPTFAIDIFDQSNNLLESFNTSRDQVFHVGVAAVANYTVRITNIGEDKSIIPFTDLDNGKFTLNVKQADTSKDYESESNASIISSDSITLGRTIEGQLSNASDVDWFKVRASQKGALEITFTDSVSNYFISGYGGSHLYKIDVFDKTGSVLLESFNYQDGYTSTWRVGVTGNEDYVFKVSHDAASGALDTGWYNLTIIQAPTNIDYESEINNTFTTADTLTLGRTMEGQLSLSHEQMFPQKNVDWFRITPLQKGALEITFTDSISNYVSSGYGGSHLYTVEIYDKTGTNLLESFNYQDGYTNTWRVGVIGSENYFVKVSHDSSTGALDTGWYNITVAQAATNKDYEFEHNDTYGTATPISLGRTVEGQLSFAHERLSPLNNVDWYKINPIQRGALEITFTDSISNFFSSGNGGSHLYKVEIYDKTGTNLLESFNYQDGYTNTWRVGVTGNDDYYIKVSHDAMSGALDTGWYNLNVIQAPTNIDYESEQNDTFGTASTLTLGRTMEGQLSLAHEQISALKNVDWYRVTPAQKGALEITFTDSISNYVSSGSGGSHLYKVEVYDKTGTNLLESFNYQDGYTSTWRVGVIGSEDYFIKVSHDSSTGSLDSGWYNITVAQAATNKDYEFERNDTLGAATTINLGRPMEGQLSLSHEKLSPLKNIDWYKATPNQKGALEISFTDNIDYRLNSGSGGSHLYRIDIYDKTGSVLLESFNYQSGYTSVWRVNAVSEQDYFIKVSHDAATGELDTGWYNLTVNVIDNINPILLGTSPRDDASSIGVSENIVLTMSEAVNPAYGFITLFDSTNRKERSISINDSSQVKIAGNTITIDPSSDLNEATTYYLNIDQGAVKDNAGNSFGGISGATTFNFTTARKPNTAPSGGTAIGGTATQGQTLVADTSKLIDPDGIGSMSYQWQRDGSIVSGATSSSYKLGQLDVGSAITVVVKYIDGRGTAETITSAASAPVSNINDGPTGTVNIVGSLIQGQTISANHTLEDLDGLGTISYQWQSNGINIVNAIASNYTLTQAEVGKTLSVTVKYTDGFGTVESKSSIASTTVANVNDVPIGSTLISGVVTQGQTLSASNTLSDPDGIGVISYQWQSNGININNATSASYTLTQSEVGKTITVTAKYFDGFGTLETSTASTTSAVANVNDTPTGTVMISGSNVQGQTLSASNTIGDIDGLGVISYQWQSNGIEIVGATAATYTLGPGDIGKRISVIARYIDGFGNPESKASNMTNAIQNSDIDAPTVVSFSPAHQASSVNVFSDLILTFNESIAKGNGTVVIKNLNGSVIATYDVSNSSNLTVSGSTLTINPSQDLSFGTTYKIELTSGSIKDIAGNSYAGTTNYSFTTMAMPNNVPTGSITLNGISQQGQTLTVETSRLTDGDGLGSFSFQWQRSGVAISGANSNTYLLTQNDVGASINILVKYIDGRGNSESVSSIATSSVTNVNDLPTGAVTITGSPIQGQTLSVSNTLVDLDGLGVVSYQWQSNGYDITNATTPLYTLTENDVGKVISVVARYKDGFGNSESKTSGATVAVANLNDPPIGTVTISGQASLGETLTAITSLSDLDGIGLFSYQWLRNGTSISGATTSNYTLVAADVGTALSIVVKYTDGHGNLESSTSKLTDIVRSLDVTAPIIINFSPADEAQNIELGRSIVLNFNESIVRGSGLIQLKDVNSRTIISYPVETSNNISIQGSTLTIDPSKNLSPNTEYTIELAPGSIKDLSGNSFAGTSNYNFRTIAIADLHIVGNDAGNILQGDAGNDTLDGGHGNDALYGMDGNDIFDLANGNSGNDTLFGGNGNDRFYVDAVGDLVVEYFDEGIDTVLVPFDYSILTLPNIENLMSYTNMGVSLSGNSKNNYVVGADGSDTLKGNGGYDFLDGQGGLDTAVFSQNLSNYSVTKFAWGYSIYAKDLTEMVDSTNIESLKFADMTVNLSIQRLAAATPKANVQRLIELYVAFFNRVPDADGLAYWISEMNAGQTTNQIANSFYNAGVQYTSVTGFSSSMSNADFVNTIYRNVLGRKDGADAGGLAYWTDGLKNGTESRGSLVSKILDAAHSFKGDTTWGWVANLLDNKILVAKTFAVDWGLGFTSPYESITQGMAIAGAITPNDTTAAFSLIGISPLDLSL